MGKTLSTWYTSYERINPLINPFNRGAISKNTFLMQPYIIIVRNCLGEKPSFL